MVDSADGGLDAKYEYGAFGKTLRVSGTTITDDNPFRFSTKYTDSDGARQRVDGDAEGVARRAEEAGAPWALMRQSGLIYYGFRYYSASMGRFLNRDPLGEAGGSNLYSFVENDPVNGWDYLGLTDVPEGLVCDPAESAAGLCDDDLPIYEVPAGPELPPFEVFPPMPPPNPDPHPIDIEFPTEEPPDLGDREAPLGPNGGGGGTKKDGCKDKKKKTKKEKKAPLDWLRKLCSTPAGRAIVQRLAKGEFSLRKVNMSNLSTGLQNAIGGYSAATSNERDGTIYMFGSNHSRIRSTVTNKFGYRGSTVDFTVSTIIHEINHFSTSPPAAAIPGQEKRFEEATVLQKTDGQLPSYGLPPIFGLGSPKAYLSIIPGGKNLSTGKSTSDYGQTANSNVMNELNTGSRMYGGWDCSRVGM